MNGNKKWKKAEFFAQRNIRFLRIAANNAQNSVFSFIVFSRLTVRIKMNLEMKYELERIHILTIILFSLRLFVFFFFVLINFSLRIAPHKWISVKRILNYYYHSEKNVHVLCELWTWTLGAERNITEMRINSNQKHSGIYLNEKNVEELFGISSN